MNYALWAVQILLTVLFLFAGGMKLFLPLEKLAEQAGPLSPLFLRFIGVCEVLGALGLVLPGVTGIQTRLTPIAAACLVVIMIGATVVTIATAGAAMAILPFVTGLLLGFVAYGRS